MACFRCGSLVLLGLCFASWVIALGGLGAINWRVCSDYDNTVKDIVDNYKANYGNASTTSAAELYFKLNIPSEEQNVALCSRSWRWEWFCLFFQFACIASATVVSFMPVRLARARYPLANMLSIATTIVMVAVNSNLTTVWLFWDSHKMFNEWTGVLRQLYFSAAALVAGWILIIIFNLIWIGFTGDHQPEPEDAKKPMTSTQA